MRLFPAPVLLALAAAVVLSALIGASSRLGLPDPLAFALMIPVGTGAAIVALGAGATMRGGVFRLGTAAIGDDAVPLLAGVGAIGGLCALTSSTLAEAARYLPALVVGLILHGMLWVGNQQPLRTRSRPMAGGAQLGSFALAIGESLLLAAACLLVLFLAADAGAAVTGAGRVDLAALLCALAVAAVIAGGRSASLSLAGFMAMAALVALAAVLLGFAAMHGWRLFPVFAVQGAAAPLQALQEAWFPLSGEEPRALPLLGQAALGVALCGFILLMRIQEALPAAGGRALATGNSLIVATLLAALLGALPFNMTQSFAEHMIGYDPNALPLWVTDGRFGSIVRLCGAALEQGSSPFCPALGDSGAVQATDLQFDPGNSVLLAALAAGLPRPAATAAALALLSLLAVGLFLMFSRLAVLLFAELPGLTRSQPLTTSASLALARIGAVITGAALAAAAAEPALHALALTFLLCALPAFTVPAFLSERIDPSPATAAAGAFAGAAAAAAVFAAGVLPLHAGAFGALAGVVLLAAIQLWHRMKRKTEPAQADGATGHQQPRAPGQPEARDDIAEYEGGKNERPGDRPAALDREDQHAGDDEADIKIDQTHNAPWVGDDLAEAFGEARSGKGPEDGRRENDGESDAQNARYHDGLLMDGLRSGTGGGSSDREHGLQCLDPVRLCCRLVPADAADAGKAHGDPALVAG